MTFLFITFIGFIMVISYWFYYGYILLDID